MLLSLKWISLCQYSYVSLAKHSVTGVCNSTFSGKSFVVETEDA